MNGDWQQTACILCECNCGIVVQLDGRNLAKIRGDKDHPASQGYTCNKALRLDHYQNSRNRLTSPLRRRPDGSYEEIDWDTAISEIADGFAKVRDEHGGDKIFYYGGGGIGRTHRLNPITPPPPPPLPLHDALPIFAGLYVQQGAAARSLSEQPQPVDLAAAQASRRQLRRDRLGHRDLRDRRWLRESPRRARRRQDLLLRRW